jgi:hypothetical protein
VATSSCIGAQHGHQSDGRRFPGSEKLDHLAAPETISYCLGENSSKERCGMSSIPGMASPLVGLEIHGH